MRPLLAPIDSVSHPKYWEKVGQHYPLLGSPKLDGIRCITAPWPDRAGGTLTQAMSRSWKRIPSWQVQKLVERLPPWLDGELIEGRATDGDVYNRTQSHVMSELKPGDISLHLFDYAHPGWRNEPYFERLEELHRIYNEHLRGSGVQLVEQSLLLNQYEVEQHEEKQLALGYEGTMLRSRIGYYKEGRATLNQGIIYKLKRTVDAEGVVVDFIERMKNNNEQVVDERGYAKRSSHQANKVGMGTVGKFKVEFEGRIINVAPGKLNHDQLQEIWNEKESFAGKLLKFRYFSHGIKDEPRHARALGWRSGIDL